jgi:hypothetical protein
MTFALTMQFGLGFVSTKFFCKCLVVCGERYYQIRKFHRLKKHGNDDEKRENM